MEIPSKGVRQRAEGGVNREGGLRGEGGEVFRSGCIRRRDVDVYYSMRSSII